MSQPPVFVNRRKENDRRIDADPCKDMPMDLLHRKRRKSVDRRQGEKSLVDDYYAFHLMQSDETDYDETEQ